MKIFCIGKNYAKHAAEMNSEVPSQPLVFMKPATALLKDNNPFYYPEFSKEVHYEVEIILKVAKNGKYVQPAFSKSYFTEIGLGIDFTARDLQAQCKAKGHPWEISKAFDHSAAVGKFIPISDFDSDNISFHLLKNGKKVQSGNTKDLIFNFSTLVEHISKFFKIQKGDLIFTGTPEGVGPVQIGDKLEGFIGDKKMFEYEIK